MKRYVIIFISLIFTQLGYAQEQEVEDTPKLGALLVVDTLQHNFGVIDSRGSDVHYSFYIENRGDSPLVISRVEKSCSCIKTHLSNSRWRLARGVNLRLHMRFGRCRSGYFRSR